MRALHLSTVALLTTTLFAVTSCSDDDSDGTITDIGGTQPGGATQSGKIVQALSGGTPVGVATVTIAGRSVRTNADGTYVIPVPKGSPYSMVVTADGYYKLTEQDWISNQDVLEWGETQLLATSIGNLLTSFLTGRDAAKGTLVVRVVALLPCASADGATVSLDPPGASQLRYIEGGTPKATATSVKADEAFSAVFYNVEPGAAVNVKVASPGCAQKPYPVDVQGVTFTGTQTIEGGQALTFTRVFLGG